MFQGYNSYQSQITELEPRPLFKKIGFSGQIRTKFELW